MRTIGLSSASKISAGPVGGYQWKKQLVRQYWWANSFVKNEAFIRGGWIGASCGRQPERGLGIAISGVAGSLGVFTSRSNWPGAVQASSHYTEYRSGPRQNLGISRQCRVPRVLKGRAARFSRKTTGEQVPIPCDLDVCMCMHDC